MTAILDIQLDKAQAVAEEILSQGGKKSIAVRMDVTDSCEWGEVYVLRFRVEKQGDTKCKPT